MVGMGQKCPVPYNLKNRGANMSIILTVLGALLMGAIVLAIVKILGE